LRARCKSARRCVLGRAHSLRLCALPAFFRRFLFAARKHDPDGSEPIAVVHRTYARALFEAAKEQDRLQQVSEELADFAAAVRDVPELRSALRNPQLEPRAKAAVLDELLRESEELVRNFLRLTAEKGRIGQIEEIAREFDRLMAKEERRLDVELTTARELSDDEARELLKQIEKASGRKVEATRKVDPNLIGGFVLQAGSMRVDASVRGRLEGLRHELVRGR
jgi:F-type H+-transporting ATPase subunit delta